MDSSYPVRCPQEDCGWSGSLVHSRARGGTTTDAKAGQLVWFQCPRCRRDWEARVQGERAITFPTLGARG